VPNLCQCEASLPAFTGVFWHNRKGQAPQVADLIKIKNLPYQLKIRVSVVRFRPWPPFKSNILHPLLALFNPAPGLNRAPIVIFTA